MDGLMPVIAWGAGLFALFVVVAVGFSARSMVRPGRIKVWTDPKREFGADFESITFTTNDDVKLAGWFIPAARGGAESGAPVPPGPAAIVLHGWCWNRCGTRQNSPLNDFPFGLPVDLMPAARALHEAGYHVLMYDMRNFGESERRGVYTGGWLEKRDLIGALDYLAARPEVDAERMVVQGFSVGGNIILYALPHTRRIRAAFAIQPARVGLFMANFGRKNLKGIGWLIVPLVEWVYRLYGGPALRDIDPALEVVGADDTPVLFLEGTGDRWGSVDDVRRMAEATPGNQGLMVIETNHRYAGYNWAAQHPEVALDFFAKHIEAPEPPVTAG